MIKIIMPLLAVAEAVAAAADFVVIKNNGAYEVVIIIEMMSTVMI